MSVPDEQEEFVLSLIGCQDRLRGFLRCLLIAPGDLDDLLQETNRILVKKAGTFTPGTDFWAWACQVARFEVLAHHRRRSRDRHLFDSEFIEDLASRAESQFRDQSDVETALKECLKQVSAANTRLLDSRYAEGLSAQQIAERLNRPVGSVRQSLYRIRQQLRACLERRVEGMSK